MPEAVVFDIGRVLIHWEPAAFYDREIGRDARKRLFAEVPIESANLSVDRGEPFRETIYGLAAEHPEWADAIRLWHDRWLEMASPAKDDTVALMRALQSRGVRCWALSNFGAEPFEIAEQAYPFLAEFDGRVISAHVGTVKPEPEIYETLELASGLSGASLFFTDDRPENVAAATARGWHGHLFDGAKGLAQALVAHGLLTEKELA
ncbi:HAD-IA family hydrolase [Lutimaribacter sp. EGI FJ00015]|uniref:HAD-IA family hydrolase n=1 Tax=Lutimaribacter degradans TaxID=2945989 RepID=A0ACC5ZWT1_9RHOB|nr:HAD-IA family hydrolase [Lutimaribacter sp. EGI FJ00013]MCM2562781.1 HAD-IA family hydrolase [Lutimaribacter sp. EGI FJ00013]MCO0613938.1 HAD-IA family hydrolase [Lutimaribacter sp. EGI FJ00015]MCO0636910.1 HAD-IA family hydrolase [Lutimaribacter sp. EGI FJ00014]